MKRPFWGSVVIYLFFITACVGKGEKYASVEPSFADTRVSANGHTIGYNTLCNPYFGQMHLHTSWSFDAYINHERLGPEFAYKHALGELVKLPNGEELQLQIPLDFLAITDHAEYLGVLRQMEDSRNPISKHPLAKKINSNNADTANAAFAFLLATTIQKDGTARPDPLLNDSVLRLANWMEMVELANKYYKPGKFTSFAAYEWSSQPNASNLHRDIIFKNTKQLPIPFSFFDSGKPEDLWNWMDVQRAKGISLMAIPSNGNLSNGTMYNLADDKGKPFSREYAAARARNEPLSEIVQTIGQSETNPLIDKDDPFAGFETGALPVDGTRILKINSNNYIRHAWMSGLKFEKAFGLNPFKFGALGGGDSHSGLINHEEYSFNGDGKSKLCVCKNAGPLNSSDTEASSTGLSGVWAVENTREAIYDAMERKETWATSGTRITVRFFAGWDFDGYHPDSAAWVKKGYEKGVPMGGDLPKRIAGTSPQLMIWAIAGPNDANLDRIQVVKGWVNKKGKTSYKIYNVCWSGDRVPDKNGVLTEVGTTVNKNKASYTNTIGSRTLKTVWKDPDFDPDNPAFYYLRVLEIPTPRWTTYACARKGVKPPTNCSASIQERAWTSPVWYTPNK